MTNTTFGFIASALEAACCDDAAVVPALIGVSEPPIVITAAAITFSTSAQVGAPHCRYTIRVPAGIIFGSAVVTGNALGRPLKGAIAFSAAATFASEPDEPDDVVDDGELHPAIDSAATPLSHASATARRADRLHESHTSVLLSWTSELTSGRRRRRFSEA